MSWSELVSFEDAVELDCALQRAFKHNVSSSFWPATSSPGGTAITQSVSVVPMAYCSRPMSTSYLIATGSVLILVGN